MSRSYDLKVKSFVPAWLFFTMIKNRLVREDGYLCFWILSLCFVQSFEMETLKCNTFLAKCYFVNVRQDPFKLVFKHRPFGVSGIPNSCSTNTIHQKGNKIVQMSSAVSESLKYFRVRFADKSILSYDLPISLLFYSFLLLSFES